MFQIGHPPGPGINDLAVAADGQLASRIAGMISFEYRIDGADRVLAELGESGAGEGGS